MHKSNLVQSILLGTELIRGNQLFITTRYNDIKSYSTLSRPARHSCVMPFFVNECSYCISTSQRIVHYIQINQSEFIMCVCVNSKAHTVCLNTLLMRKANRQQSWDDKLMIQQSTKTIRNSNKLQKHWNCLK